MWPFSKKQTQKDAVFPSYSFDEKPRYRVVPTRPDSFRVEKMSWDGRWVSDEEYRKDYFNTFHHPFHYTRYPISVVRKTAKEAEEYIKNKIDSWEESKKRNKEIEAFKKANPPYELPPYREYVDVKEATPPTT
jgi:hypothetical protein